MAGLVASLPAAAQTDPASRDQLRDIHRNLVIAEGDLGIALRDKDVARAKSASGALFKLLSSASCLALRWPWSFNILLATNFQIILQYRFVLPGGSPCHA